jgi:hypothetical protein
MLQLALVLSLASSWLPAPVGPPVFKVPVATLGDLTDRAKIIVVGEVTAVNGDWRSAPGELYRVADVRVTKVLKGPADLRQIRYVAQGTWTCDITGGEVGERGVYFLSESKLGAAAGLVYSIAHSGRGRMELRTIEGEVFATVWSGDVLLPKSIRTVDGPEPQYTFIRSVPLGELQEAIEVFDDVQSRPVFAAHATPRSAFEDAFSFTVGQQGGCLLGKYVQEGAAARSRYGPKDRLFRIEKQRLKTLLQQLEEQKTGDLPARLGEAKGEAGTRYLDCWVNGLKRSTCIDTVTQSSMNDPVTADATRRGLRAWGLLRAVVEDSKLPDWREADAP